MNVCELNEEQLRAFLKYCFTIESLRHIFNHSNALKQTIKGFRVETASDELIINAVEPLIAKKKDLKLISMLNEFYNTVFLRELNEKKEEFIKEGFDEDFAYSLVIENVVNKEFLKTFFEIEKISLEKQKLYENNIKTYVVIEKIVEKKKESIEQENLTRYQSLESKVDKHINHDLAIYATMNNSKILVEMLQEKLKIEINNLEVYKNNFFNKNDFVSLIDKKILKAKEELKKEFDDFMLKREEIFYKKIMENVNTLIKKNNQINSKVITKKEETFKEKATEEKQQNIIVDYIKNKEYGVSDEELELNIGDILEDNVNGAKFDCLREYLIEIIFSNKPIICTKKNSKFFATLLSSIITGSNYYEILLEANSNDKQLIEEIEKMECIEQNKVILIKNKINVSDHQFLLEYIKKCTFNYKFIFEIYNDNEIIYMPTEILNDFNFYLGEIEFKKPGYSYAYNFSKENRKSLKNSSFDEDLENLGIKNEENFLMNVKYYGLLAFSILPFIKIHENIEYNDLFNKIANSSYRQKCEETLNGIEFTK